MKENNIQAEVQGRIKRIYSIYDKMKRQNIPFDRVYDFAAFRIIAESIRDCYALLGLIHNIWTPIPGRIKDYIAIPKPNFYQSLHTSVMMETGFAFEVQIRTREMNEIAENGIAAHWLYKEGKTLVNTDKSKQFLKQLYDWQLETKDPREFMKSLKSSLYPEEIYVLTPKGDVRAFPQGATPIDFAYAIHSQVGTQCTGAKVNGKIVTLNYQLKNGDMIEIITQASHHPSPDWLSYVVTSRAKSKIKTWLNAEERRRAIEQGKKLLEQQFRKKRLNISKYLKDEILYKFYQELGYNQVEDFFAGIGYAKVNVKKLVDNIILTLSPESPEAEKVKESMKAEIAESDKSVSSPIKVKEVDGLLITMGKCCNPIKGEEIVGYVTKGRGISIHSLKCPNIEKILYNPDKLVQVEWDTTDQGPQTSHLIIRTEDNVGILAEITDKIATNNINIKSFKGQSTEDKISVMKLSIEVHDIRQLEKIINGIRAIKGVISIKRALK
jgi:GTP diphosphokinase / guanosine-3',5'-bis(diphosphate) 3'-diphosphatase